MDERFDEALLPRAILEAYAVPEVPSGFADQVMAQVHPPTFTQTPPRTVVPWIVAGLASACALAAMALLALRWQPEPTPVTPPVSAAPDVAVPADHRPVAPAPQELPAVAIAPAPTGDLVIATTPRDAIVRIDGNDVTNKGGGSPHIRTKLATGPHTVEVSRDGFASWQSTVDLPARALELTISLEPVVPPSVPSTPTRRPTRPKSTGGSPDLKDPFGSPARAKPDPMDLSDPFSKH